MVAFSINNLQRPSLPCFTTLSFSASPFPPSPLPLTMSLRSTLLLAACLLMAASSFVLADSRRHKDYDRAAANSNSWPLWLTALAITFGVGALAVCGCALSIVGWSVSCRQTGAMHVAKH